MLFKTKFTLFILYSAEFSEEVTNRTSHGQCCEPDSWSILLCVPCRQRC